MPFFQGVSYDATFESVDVPESIREMKEQVLLKQGGKRKDDVEFTFEKGRWGHLGEATLVNRVKSHPDVGERWYPEILRGIRTEQQMQAEKERETKQQMLANNGTGSQQVRTSSSEMGDHSTAIQAH